MEFEFAEFVEMDPTVRRWPLVFIHSAINYFPEFVFDDIDTSALRTVDKGFDLREGLALGQIIGERKFEGSLDDMVFRLKVRVSNP